MPEAYDVLLQAIRGIQLTIFEWQAGHRTHEEALNMIFAEALDAEMKADSILREVNQCLSQ